MALTSPSCHRTLGKSDGSAGRLWFLSVRGCFCVVRRFFFLFTTGVKSYERETKCISTRRIQSQTGKVVFMTTISVLPTSLHPVVIHRRLLKTSDANKNFIFLHNDIMEQVVSPAGRYFSLSMWFNKENLGLTDQAGLSGSTLDLDCCT